MELVELLRIFQVFLSASLPQGSCRYYAGVLAMQLNDRLGQFRTRDIRSLSRTFIEYFDLKRGRDLNRQELSECCHRIPKVLAWSGDAASIPMQPLRFPSFKSEVASNGEMEEVSTTLSELSENFEEELESSGLFSCTELKLSQVSDSSPTAADHMRLMNQEWSPFSSSSAMQPGFPSQWNNVVSPTNWCAVQGPDLYGYGYGTEWDAAQYAKQQYYYQQPVPLMICQEEAGYATDDGF
jgi:hypothetical protein